jgi:hypothetical protein
MGRLGGTWRRVGDDVVLTMNGEAEERLASHQLIRYDPASTDQRVEGRWQSSLAAVTQVAANAASAVASRSLALHADGRFVQLELFQSDRQYHCGRDFHDGGAGAGRPLPHRRLYPETHV